MPTSRQPVDANAATSSQESNFILESLPRPLEASLLDIAAQVEPATLGHVLEEGFSGPEIRRLSGSAAVCGTVLTCRSVGSDSAIVHYAVSQLRRGDFLVIDRAGDQRFACFGGGLALAARQAGCVGVAVDGPVTDVAELQALGLSVWATGLTALTTRRQYTQGEFCRPISFSQQTVEPGMLAIADDNGIVFLREDGFRAVAPRALEMQRRQQMRYERVQRGELLAEMNGVLDAFHQIKAARAVRREPGGES